MVAKLDGARFRTILADPPWQFQNRTGKMAPEHRRLARYGTMGLDDICALPVAGLAEDTAHLYLWVPNAMLPEGLRVMQAWGFAYKTNIVWHKVRRDGGPDGRGVGFYFRNTTELVLFGVRGRNARTRAPGRRQVNIVKSQKREHSRKPDELYDVVEACSEGPYLELFARGPRAGWTVWGDQADDYAPSWATYANHSAAAADPGLRYSANAVMPAAARAGRVPPSLLASDASRKGPAAGAMPPEVFLRDWVRPASGGRVPAIEAWQAYAARCRSMELEAVPQLAFRRAFAQVATALGARRIRVGGQTVYADIAAAA